MLMYNKVHSASSSFRALFCLRSRRFSLIATVDQGHKKARPKKYKLERAIFNAT